MPRVQEVATPSAVTSALRNGASRSAEPPRSASMPAASLLWPPSGGLTQILPELPGLPPVEVIEAQLSAVEREMDGLRDEVDSLRKRDRTLNFYMQRLDEELRLAARLQQEFLPKAMPEVGPVRFHALWRPAGYVSGDLYDVMRLDERHIGFYIADAVGHGMPAALLSMFIKNALVTKEISQDSYRLIEPGESLTRLNEALLSQHLTAGTFCTAFYGVLNTETLDLRMASAGHPAPLLLRGEDGPQPVRAVGPLLGIFEGEIYPTTTHQLQHGDRLVLYTDGMEVAFGPSDEPDAERWRAEVVKRQSMGGEALVQDLMRQLDGASGSLDPRDDQTLLVVEVV